MDDKGSVADVGRVGVVRNLSEELLVLELGEANEVSTELREASDVPVGAIVGVGAVVVAVGIVVGASEVTACLSVHEVNHVCVDVEAVLLVRVQSTNNGLKHQILIILLLHLDETFDTGRWLGWIFLDNAVGKVIVCGSSGKKSGKCKETLHGVSGY